MEFTRPDGQPRIVVTGLSAITPLGKLRDFWESLIAGQSGIRQITSFSTEHLRVKIAGEVLDFDPHEFISSKEARRMSRASQMGLAAAQLAVEDAGLDKAQIEAETGRVGITLGTALGGSDVAVDSASHYRETHRKPNPFSLVSSLPNMPGYHISEYFKAGGPLTTISAACASGAQSIGAAADYIRTRRTDIMITGGVECVLQDYSIAGFDAMRALTDQYNDNPEAASRPFDADRSGFVFSEGAAIVILESLEHAVKRGARILCEFLGHGESSDAFHFAAPDAEGIGRQRAIRWALQDSRVNPEDIDYINAHGTSTIANDSVETLAIKRIFGETAYNIPISSTKSMIGHCMGAAGAVEAAASIMTLVDQVIHPTINYETPDPECDLDYVPNTARNGHRIRKVMSNSFGLGGQNSTLIFSAF